MSREHEPREPGPGDPTEIARACEALSITYARAVDFRDQDTFVSLFTEDGERATGTVLTGRAAIRKAAPLAAPAAVGDYADRFQRTAEGWRFKRRKLQLAFRRD